MNTNTLRLKLIDWISKLEDEELLQKIDSLRRFENKGWKSLSVDDQMAIEEGLNQLNEGKDVSYLDFRKEIESILDSKS